MLPEVLEEGFGAILARKDGQNQKDKHNGSSVAPGDPFSNTFGTFVSTLAPQGAFFDVVLRSLFKARFFVQFRRGQNLKSDDG